MKQMRRLVYRCSLLSLFEDVVLRARERVVGLYSPPYSLRLRMRVTSLNHEMNMVDNVLSNLGNREEEGGFSSRMRCYSPSVDVATLVKLVKEAIRVAMIAEFCCRRASCWRRIVAIAGSTGGGIGVAAGCFVAGAGDGSGGGGVLFDGEKVVSLVGFVKLLLKNLLGSCLVRCDTTKLYNIERRWRVSSRCRSLQWSRSRGCMVGNFACGQRSLSDGE